MPTAPHRSLISAQVGTRRNLNKSVHRCGRRFWGAAWLLACSWLAVGTGLQAAPKVMVEQPAFDFGIITNGSFFYHDFIIRNTGDADLIVSHVKSSCTVCLQVGISQAKIRPGGQALVYSQLDLRLMSGPVARAIMVECNDPQNPILILELSGTAIPVYQLKPLQIGLDLSQGQPTGTTEIVSLFPLHAPLSQIICDNTNLEVGISQKSATEFELRVKARPLPAGQNFSVPVKVCSTDSNDPPCFTSIWIRNPPEVEVLPATLMFLPREGEQTRILWVKQHGAEPLALMEVEAPSNHYQCVVDPNPVGNDYRIYLNATQLNQVAGQTNTLTLKFKDAHNAEKCISVPLITERTE